MHSQDGTISSLRQQTSLGASKTEILINVYDLLPAGKLSNALWFLGSSLLHTGLVVKALNREYAFGGHDRPGLSGVYYTKPKCEPPGGTWRCELLHGFTFSTEEEIEDIIRAASSQFHGTSYNLLTNNCNHFTSFLCEKLTGRPAPAWLNRAASIGIALPCVVPREWVSPPDHDTADGELVEDEEDERTSMLKVDYQRARDDFRGSQGHADERLTFEEGQGSSKDIKGKGAVRRHGSFGAQSSSHG